MAVLPLTSLPPTRRTALGIVAALLAGAASLQPPLRIARADSQPTDDNGGPAVDTEQGLIFVTGAEGIAEAGAAGSGGATVPYEWVVRFTGTYEQTITIYQWAEEPNGGCWKRRAFLNSYFQGAAMTVSVALAARQKFLIVAYHKDADPPATEQGWAQSRMDHGDVSKLTGNRPLPLVEVVFKHDKGASLVWLRPDSRSVPATQPVPRIRQGQ